MTAGVEGDSSWKGVSLSAVGVALLADFLLLYSIREIRGGGGAPMRLPHERESHGQAAVHLKAMIVAARCVKRGLREPRGPPPPES